MKKSVYLIPVLFAILLTSCGPTTEQARQYNDKLIAQEVKVIKALDAVDNAFSTYKPEIIEPAIEKAKKQIDKSVKIINEIGDFDGDSEFKNETLNLFNLFKKHLNNEYAEQLELYKLSDEEYTEKEEARWNELSEKMNDEYTKVFNKFSEAQESFAEKWGFPLESRN